MPGPVGLGGLHLVHQSQSTEYISAGCGLPALSTAPSQPYAPSHHARSPARHCPCPRRKQYCLRAGPQSAATRPIIDEDEDTLPLQRRFGVAHPVAAYEPASDAGFFPNGLRLPRRDVTRRSAADSAAVTVALVDCDIDVDERSDCPPADYGSWHLYGPLGMANITDFEHYHYNPEASEMSACLLLLLSSLRGAPLGAAVPAPVFVV